MFQGDVATLVRVRLTVRFGDIAPCEGRDVALRYPTPEKEQRPQQQLCLGLALFGGFHEPRSGLTIVLHHTKALVEQKSDASLGLRVAAFGRSQPLPERTRVVATVVG